MKINHKSILLALLCAISLSVCSCGKKENADAPVSATQQAEDSSAKTGVVVEASMHTLAIAASDGTTYVYTVDDSTVFEGESENLGDTVTVTVDGEYSENALAESIKVVNKADESVSVSAAEVKDTKNDSPKKSENAVKYITAVVKDASMHNVTVEWGGKQYSVKKDDKTSVEGNITVGSTVRIYHTGAMADGITAIDISVVAPEIVNKDIKYITGKVVDASMNSIIIENNGHQYSVKKTDETKSDSVAVGDTVRVYHKGSFADGMTATSIIKQ